MTLYGLIAQLHGRVWSIYEPFADDVLAETNINARDYIEAHREFATSKEKEFRKWEDARMESRKETGSYFNGLLSSNGVYTMHMKGAVTQSASSFSSSGIVVPHVAQTLEMALEDKQVKGLSAIIDTPGGIAVPSLNLGELFQEFANKKPYYAYAENLLASAGLSLISSADVSTSPNIIYGGCATVMRFYDYGKRIKASGIDEYALASAPGKIDTELRNEDGSLSEESIKNLQSEIDQLGARFNAQVKRMRKMDAKEKKSFDNGGYFFSGKEAVAAGLADRVINTRLQYRQRVEKAMAKYNKGQS